MAQNPALEYILTDCLVDFSPLTCHAGFIDELAAVIFTVYYAECCPSLRTERHYEKDTVFAHHLIYDIGIGVGEIEIIITLLLVLGAYAKSALVGIIEEKY